MKNFVKKTLFDLAKEAERISSEENQSETDNSSEENVGVSQEIVKDINQNVGSDNIHSFNDIDENDNICTDIGSGAGLPGIVLAIIMKYKKSNMQFNLYEKSFNKSNFLKDV